MVAGVVPSWAIVDLIYGEEAMKKSKQAEERRRKEGLAAAQAMGPTEAVTDEEGQTEFDQTANFMGKLLGVPKDEADRVHRGHKE
jgi:hypothetical protein